jgi:short-subunit dehydrogenase
VEIMALMLDLKGRTCVVTGASSGIGAAAAIELARRGAVPVLAARRRAELDEVGSRILAAGGTAHVLDVDIGTLEGNERLVKFALEKTGRLDVFIANAGVTMVQRFQEAKLETFEQVMRINYFGTIYGFKVALPHVLEKRGQLVIVSSFTGKRGVPTRSGYAASKHALHGLGDSLRVELLGTGVGVTIYCPGFVNTEIRARAVERHEGADEEKGWTPEQAALVLVRAIERRKREVVTPFFLRMVLRANLVAPSLVDRLLRRRLG